jgi:CPA1 family monovalent cation:H+ antiporter
MASEEQVGGIMLGSEYIIPLFLVMVFAASLFSTRTRIPYTIMLVTIGIALSIFNLASPNDITTNLRIDSKLIIDFIIPPLIFEAMMKVDYEQFKKIRISALVLATAGVVIATLVGGFLLMLLAGLPFLISFAFAALIAPTDAAIVIEIFKRVKVPRRLSTLMESESSFNDATGIIAFSSILALAFGSGSAMLGSSFPTGTISFDLVGEAEHFAVVFFGGAGIGLAIAAGAHRLHALMDDQFSEVALTVASVFGAVILSNALGVSGLVAVAIVGLYFGNVTIRHESVISHKVRESAFTFWEMAAFFANSAAFLYLGVTMDLLEIGESAILIVIAFGVALAARAASVYPILFAVTALTKEKIPMSWRNVVFLGGMRGAISVALVASLPESPFKVTLESITFGVVLASLLLQYLMLSQYIKRRLVPNGEDFEVSPKA